MFIICASSADARWMTSTFTTHRSDMKDFGHRATRALCSTASLHRARQALLSLQIPEGWPAD
jgi:hypothetical protein